MKMYVISDNIDTKTGMRLAGIKGIVVHTKPEVEAAIREKIKDTDIGVLLITEKLGTLVPELIDHIKTVYQTPLIVEIPDRHGSTRGPESITRYVRDAVGLKL